jgi:hypothetical protein
MAPPRRLLDLSEECLVRVLLHVNNARDLCRLSLVCRRLRAVHIAHSDDLWSRLCARDHPVAFARHLEVVLPHSGEARCVFGVRPHHHVSAAHGQRMSGSPSSAVLGGHSSPDARSVQADRRRAGNRADDAVDPAQVNVSEHSSSSPAPSFSPESRIPRLVPAAGVETNSTWIGGTHPTLVVAAGDSRRSRGRGRGSAAGCANWHGAYKTAHAAERALMRMFNLVPAAREKSGFSWGRLIGRRAPRRGSVLI